MNRERIISLLCVGLLLISSHVSALKLELANGKWSVTAAGYQAASKNGYLNSLKTDGKEFLAQEKVASGSYLCSGKILPLKELKKSDENTITGSSEFGTVTYEFTDKDITCKFTNKFAQTVVFYFIMNKNVTTVIANGAGMLEVPVKSCKGRSFILV
ncbi:MAG: hypothetical protein PHH77_12520 [Victivallaceae bacterium]|nr:hypothetical protein [Victivallaceae bacterium]